MTETATVAEVSTSRREMFNPFDGHPVRVIASDGGRVSRWTWPDTLSPQPTSTAGGKIPA